MRGPQLEDGFTRIANEILEIVSKAKFNGTQFKILIVIWRYTYGFNRKSSEFSLNFLSEATNSNKQQIKRELDKLIEGRVILIVTEANFNSSRKLTFNKNYNEWNIGDLIINEKSTVSELEYTTVSELAYTTVSGLEYQERKIKESIKKDTITTREKESEVCDNKNLVARVGADPTKQDKSLMELESFYLREVRKRISSTSNDMRDMVQAYETYKDLDFIKGVLLSATKENIKRNGKCKINSFSYFFPILADEWERINMIKEVGTIEPVRPNRQESPKYDLSEFLWRGEEN